MLACKKKKKRENKYFATLGLVLDSKRSYLL